MTGEPVLSHRHGALVFVDTVKPLPLVDPTTAARYLKVKRHTLACYRNLGQGPRYYKFGRWIRYSWPDLRSWVSPSEPTWIAPAEPEHNDGGRHLVDTPTAARFLTVTRFCLYNYRAEGSGPPFHRYGRRLYYALEELKDWAEQQRR